MLLGMSIMNMIKSNFVLACAWATLMTIMMSSVAILVFGSIALIRSDWPISQISLIIGPSMCFCFVIVTLCLRGLNKLDNYQNKKMTETIISHLENQVANHFKPKPPDMITVTKGGLWNSPKSIPSSAYDVPSEAFDILEDLANADEQDFIALKLRAHELLQYLNFTSNTSSDYR